MTWIESHTTLARHPKTLRLTKALGISVPCAVGHLHMLWWWALEYAQDGDLSGFDADEIALACYWEGEAAGFWSALQSAGFIDAAGHIHDWHEYAGKLLERRAHDAERKRAGRRGDVQNPPLHSNTPVRGTSEGHPADGVRTVPNQPHQPNRTQPNRTQPTEPDQPARGRDTAPLVVRPAPKPDVGGDAIWSALAGIFGEPLTEGERRKRTDACKQFREGAGRNGMPPDLMAALIREAHQNWGNVMGDATETPNALANNLSALVNGPQKHGRNNGTVRTHKQTVTETALVTRHETPADLRRRRQEVIDAPQ